MKIDLSELNNVQLYAIRSVLVNGGLATASNEVKQLKRENARLKTLNYRRGQVTEAGLDWDAEYWMSFEDGAFEYFLNLIIEHKTQAEKEAAIAEMTQSIRVPRIIGERDLNALDTLREGLRGRNNGNGGR